MHHYAIRKKKNQKQNKNNQKNQSKHTLFPSFVGHFYEARENPVLLCLVSMMDAQSALAVASRNVVTKQMLPLKCW